MRPIRPPLGINPARGACRQADLREVHLEVPVAHPVGRVGWDLAVLQAAAAGWGAVVAVGKSKSGLLKASCFKEAHRRADVVRLVECRAVPQVECRANRVPKIPMSRSIGSRTRMRI